jgi:hypothetical protein
VRQPARHDFGEAQPSAAAHVTASRCSPTPVLEELNTYLEAKAQKALPGGGWMSVDRFQAKLPRTVAGAGIVLREGQRIELLPAKARTGIPRAPHARRGDLPSSRPPRGTAATSLNRRPVFRC